jgi:hypothetical protein
MLFLLNERTLVNINTIAMVTEIEQKTPEEAAIATLTDGGELVLSEEEWRRLKVFVRSSAWRGAA